MVRRALTPEWCLCLPPLESFCSFGVLCCACGWSVFKKASRAMPGFWLTACSFVRKTWPIMTGSLALKLDSGYCFLLSLSLVSRKISHVATFNISKPGDYRLMTNFPNWQSTVLWTPTLAHDLPSKDSMAGGTLPKSAMNLI